MEVKGHGAAAAEVMTSHLVVWTEVLEDELFPDKLLQLKHHFDTESGCFFSKMQIVS